MAGLLGGFIGDDTVKDDYGQTQADRRDPLWAGLIKAGLLGVAAGGNLMPSERAKYMAQMGGAISDIPEDMRKQQATAAQTMLRGQDIQKRKQEIANKAKLAEYAKTPEFQEALSKLDPARRALAQAALNSGDVADAVKVVTGQDTANYHAQQLDLSRQRNEITAAANANLADKREADIRRQAEELKVKQDAEARKAGEVKPMTPARAWTVINDAVAKYQAGDESGISSVDYRAAHTLLTNPHSVKDVNGNQQDLPGFDLHWAPEPTLNATGKPPTDRPKAQKSLDNKELEGVTKTLQTHKELDDVLGDMDAHPGMKIGNWENLAAGMVPKYGASVLNDIDPKGQRARGAIANMASMIIKDRAGTAMTLQEYARLRGFLPDTEVDSPEQIRVKMKQLKESLNIETKLYYDNLKNKNAAIPPDLEARVRTIGKNGMTISPENIKLLEGDPTPERKKLFDEHYGKGAADRVLGR